MSKHVTRTFFNPVSSLLTTSGDPAMVRATYRPLLWDSACPMAKSAENFWKVSLTKDCLTAATLDARNSQKHVEDHISCKYTFPSLFSEPLSMPTCFLKIMIRLDQDPSFLGQWPVVSLPVFIGSLIPLAVLILLWKESVWLEGFFWASYFGCTKVAVYRWPVPYRWWNVYWSISHLREDLPIAGSFIFGPQSPREQRVLLHTEQTLAPFSPSIYQGASCSIFNPIITLRNISDSLSSRCRVHRGLGFYFFEDWHERWVAWIWISCGIASLLFSPIYPRIVLALSYVYKPFYLCSFTQYDPQLLQSYISGSLLVDLGIFMSPTTVLHNVLLPITYVSTNTSFTDLPLFFSLCTTTYCPLVLISLSMW